MVIDRPDIHYMIELSAHEFLIVIGYITGEIGRRTRRADEHFVLVLGAIVAGQEPDGAVPFGQVTLFTQPLQHQIHQAIVVKALLSEPAVKVYAELAQLFAAAR